MAPEELKSKLHTLRMSPINTLAFIGRMIKPDNEEFLKENEELISCAQFQSLAQAAINWGIHCMLNQKLAEHGEKKTGE